MKKFLVSWEYLQTGVSHINAIDLDDAKVKADTSVTDFGDPEQFTPIQQWNEGWTVKSIKEE